ncbi:hypothetical protein CLF_106453 [Clonorchis sinensis]|uniref:Secreted protein n=1 Tax=Clonorchis sinensis TaxID=79923 RepID=G7YF71_CLOSI|nr:hypothetical protein CLF_106453 [Clonorchis sinensis]
MRMLFLASLGKCFSLCLTVFYQEHLQPQKISVGDDSFYSMCCQFTLQHGSRTVMPEREREIERLLFPSVRWTISDHARDKYTLDIGKSAIQ